MAMRFVTEHPGGSALVREHFRKLPTVSKHPRMQALAFDTQLLGPPHSVYDLHTHELAAGKPLMGCLHTRGHRYLVYASSGPVAAAEVIWHMHGPEGHRIFVNIGPFVSATAQALQYLESHDRIRCGSFEARLMRCWSLHFMAIWLKSDIEGDDLFYPLPRGAPPPFQPEQLYPLADFEGNMQLVMQR